MTIYLQWYVILGLHSDINPKKKLEIIYEAVTSLT